jgi:hypothetical protein
MSGVHPHIETDHPKCASKHTYARIRSETGVIKAITTRQRSPAAFSFAAHVARVVRKNGLNP